MVLTAAVVLTSQGTMAATFEWHETPDKAAAESGAPGTHATRGAVKSMDETTMVIERPGNRGSITFTLTPSTRREGTIVVGSTVAVRYREQGKDHIATAVALQRSKD